MSTEPSDASRPTRRDVHRLLLGAALAATVRPTAAVAAARPLFDVAVAGGGYHGLYDVIDRLAVGVRLTLRREPDNPYDARAVAIMLGDLRLGYVPRRANAPVAALLDEGATVVADVVGHLDLGDRGKRMPEGVAFTTAVDGDPRLRLSVIEAP